MFHYQIDNSKKYCKIWTNMDTYPIPQYIYIGLGEMVYSGKRYIVYL